MTLPESPRLYLREFRAEDAEALWTLNGDPEVVRYTLNVQESLSDYAQRIADYQDQYRSNGGRLGFFAAIERATNRFVGWFHLRPSRGAPDRLDLGYRLRRDAWGQGYGTEMSRALIDYAFAQLGAPIVEAAALTGNRASIRVMEKCGMHRADEFLYTARDGTKHPAVRYEINSPLQSL